MQILINKLHVIFVLFLMNIATSGAKESPFEALDAVCAERTKVEVYEHPQKGSLLLDTVTGCASDCVKLLSQNLVTAVEFSTSNNKVKRHYEEGLTLRTILPRLPGRYRASLQPLGSQSCIAFNYAQSKNIRALRGWPLTEKCIGLELIETHAADFEFVREQKRVGASGSIRESSYRKGVEKINKEFRSRKEVTEIDKLIWRESGNVIAYTKRFNATRSNGRVDYFVRCRVNNFESFNYEINLMKAVFEPAQTGEAE